MSITIASDDGDFSAALDFKDGQLAQLSIGGVRSERRSSLTILGPVDVVARVVRGQDPLASALPQLQGFQIYAWSRATGLLADWEMGTTLGHQPMTSAVLHHVRCATKPFLALAAVRAHLDGRLDLGTDLSESGALRRRPLIECA